jgi:hypothetical protein
VVVLRSECVDHIDSLSWWLSSLVLPPSSVVLFLGQYCFFGQVRLLWMCKRLQNTILERELLPLVLDCEINLGTVRVDDGLCGA